MCQTSPGLAESLGCEPGTVGTAHDFFVPIPGEIEPLILKRCPIAWLRDDASWNVIVSAIEARDLASEGNLSSFLAPGEQMTAVFKDIMRMYGGECSRLMSERMERDRVRNG
jgi:hypothetical protein